MQNTSNLSPSAAIPRIKSLIKPPPSRNSWELLLDDYLKDPNLKSKFSPVFSPHSYPIEQPFITNYPPQDSYPTNVSLPPRRYRMNLDELVYVISQVGRSDLYREMVQYIKAQSTSIGMSTSHPIGKSSNVNACSSSESFFLDFSHKTKMNENQIKVLNNYLLLILNPWLIHLFHHEYLLLLIPSMHCLRQTKSRNLLLSSILPVFLGSSI